MDVLMIKMDATSIAKPAASLTVVLALATAPAIGLGIARFAYALVLPDMRADLGWSWANSGWMNTTNALGYLIGALLAARAIDQWGAGRTVFWGAMACVLSLVLCAVLRDVSLLNAARALGGLGGGFAFVAGGVIAASVAAGDPARSSLLLGIFYAGPGLGIAISGLIVPTTLTLGGPGSWPMAWAILAVVAAFLILFLRQGLRADTSRRSQTVTTVRLGSIRFLLAGYALFGAGYIAYMTFMIAWVRDDKGTALEQALFWSMIGVAAMASPWLWSGVIGRLRNGNAFALLCTVTAIGVAIPLLLAGQWPLLVSGALFGCAFFAVVASTTAFVRRNFPKPGWGRAIGALTVSFGAGQMLGPVAIGKLNDLMGGLSSGLVVSTVLLMLGAGCALFQRDT